MQDDNDREPMPETVVISVQLAGPGADSQTGARTITITPSDVPDTPVVTIGAGGDVTEGEDTGFTLTRSDPQSVPFTSPLTISIQVTASDSTLSGLAPTTVTFDANSPSAVLEVATLDDTVVEDAGTITVLVQASRSDPPVYLTGTPNTATVTVNDNDTAAFKVSVGEASVSDVAEGSAVRITVEGDGVTFAEAQDLTLSLSGTATAGEDFTVSDANGQEIAPPYGFTLPAGAGAVNITVRAARDAGEDAGETIGVSISHGGSVIGIVTITITETAPPVVITPGITGGNRGGGDAPVVEGPIKDASHPFTDVPPSSFAGDAVARIYELGITTGRTATTYDPDTAVTRAQMATFLSRLYTAVTGKTPPVADHPFTDIEGSSAADHIARIYGLGITTGRTTTTYDPDATVTRAQMATFLSRLYTAVTGKTPPVADHPFTDIEGSSAAQHLARIYGLGITTGRTATTYDPDATVTRAQMAVFLTRLYAVATVES